MNIIAFTRERYQVFGGRDEMSSQLLCNETVAFVGLNHNFTKICNDMITELIQE